MSAMMEKNKSKKERVKLGRKKEENNAVALAAGQNAAIEEI